MLPTSSEFYRKLTLISYPLLIVYMAVIVTVLMPSEFLPIPLALTMWILPLLFPLKGIIQGNPYTHAWANFVLILYFLHGFTTLYTHWSTWYIPAIELMLVTAAFIGATFYARYKGRELGLGLKKANVSNAGKSD
ncbi:MULTISPECIES: DUF2069 domain-containing protein [Gammaproteobacteria]|uniref:DUF2069 domain-containing protein n=1 Tax=Gammaproteobacteria TaxID=1236 RepID=UPI001A9E4008|nr:MULTISPECIES: DUF2069 domain-containing protein [Gammaproteobacteria]